MSVLPSAQDVREAIRSPTAFGRLLAGPLWAHQAEVAESPARYRLICSGRQAGKSRTLAVLALHEAFRKPGARILIVSAGEVAAQRLLAEVADLASGPLLAGAVTDETKSAVVLSNGSLIMSVPASQKQIRGWAVDLLILDEAGFIEGDIWRAAEPVIVARPGSRVVMASSPWGGPEHFFRQLWQRGMDSPDSQYASWHWPTSISPLVDADLLEEIRARETAEYFAREFLAQWSDSAGCYFTEPEISACVASYELLSPESVAALNPWDGQDQVRPFSGAMGLDWAYAQDAQAAVVVSALDDGGLNSGELRYYIPWLEYAYRCPYSRWVDRAAQIAGSYGLRVVASETNGVGAAPTETLRERLMRSGTGTAVVPVWTDSKRKQSGYSKIKMMLQQGLLVLPREPELLKQLRALEFRQLASGSVQISVPERAGHDDLAVAAMQAVSCLRPCHRGGDEIPERPDLPAVVTEGGTRVPVQPRPVEWHSASYVFPAGRERSIEAPW